MICLITGYRQITVTHAPSEWSVFVHKIILLYFFVQILILLLYLFKISAREIVVLADRNCAISVSGGEWNMSSIRKKSVLLPVLYGSAGGQLYKASASTLPLLSKRLFAVCLITLEKWKILIVERYEIFTHLWEVKLIYDGDLFS